MKSKALTAAEQRSAGMSGIRCGECRRAWLIKHKPLTAGGVSVAFCAARCFFVPLMRDMHEAGGETRIYKIIAKHYFSGNAPTPLGDAVPGSSYHFRRKEDVILQIFNVFILTRKLQIEMEKKERC